MKLSSKLEKYLNIDTMLETGTYKVYEKLGDIDRKALFFAILEKYNILSPSFINKGIIRRANIISVLGFLTRKGDEEYGNIFEHFFYNDDGQVFYNAILGYAKCMQEKAYTKLLELIFNNAAPKDKRAYAVYELCLISGQKFISNPPQDEREWQDSDFPLDIIAKWDKSGRPKGNSFKNELHEKILNSDKGNDIDKLVAGIHKKYYINAWISTRDIIDGKTNITKPTQADIETLNAKWILPPTYKYFIENFVVKNELKRELCIYSADELVEHQMGFATTPEGTLIADWKHNHLVIADLNSDTCYCIDLNQGEKSPVYQFCHDDWKFKKYSNNFLEFLKKIV